MYVYKSICPHIIFYVSYIFDLKRRNYSMTCFMFVYNRLRDTDVKLINIWTMIIVVLEFICRLNKVKLSSSSIVINNIVTNINSYLSIKVMDECYQIVFIDLKNLEISVPGFCQYKHVWYILLISCSMLSLYCIMY